MGSAHPGWDHGPRICASAVAKGSDRIPTSPRNGWLSATICDGIHRALVDTFGVPPGDRFQLVHQHELGEFVCDADYLGIHRTDDLVVIEIVASHWRDTGQKKALYRAIADNLAADPGLRLEDVTVVLSPNGRDDWSFGRGLASYVTEA